MASKEAVTQVWAPRPAGLQLRNTLHKSDEKA